ncbi:MAG: copper homeostasis protein CutC [Anaerolineae bacterium]|nr:copper homeostasis protein CutC [Gemmatimonadaceae bacterium]
MQRLSVSHLLDERTSNQSEILVEAAVDTLRSAIIADRAGASRVELCANLNDGGTTPSTGLIGAVRARIRIPAFVLIRPRGGGFVYSHDDMAVMSRDVEVARGEGADGIVTGALDAHGRVDIAMIAQLTEAARELPVSFHRAFDATPDLAQALEMLIGAGVSRVLTSGGAATALEGVATIARLVDQARGRIAVMAGGGIREHNVREVIARTGVSEVHARIGSVSHSATEGSSRALRLRKPFPENENVWEELDEMRMRALIGLAQP